jgi:hypothetical protein
MPSAPDAGRRPIARLPRTIRAEASFREHLERAGATLLEPEFLGTKQKHHVRCAAGHDCYPKPNSIQQGQGICRTCGGCDPIAAESAWLTRLAALGAEPLEPYTTALAPTLIRCRGGHESRPQPSSVASGNGVCVTCAGKDPAVAEADFLQRLAELGATPLYGEWLGANAKHHVRCVSGHDCYPRPTWVRRGCGVCRACAGNDPVATEARFRERLAELGATPLYGNWAGSNNPHRIRCKAGHESTPRPSDVLQGNGVCRKCAHRDWDVFYIVTNDELQRIKFGISTGDGRPRLRTHRAAGYRRLVRLMTSLPGDAALEMEQSVKAVLRLAREIPEHGREYFGIHVLGTVLDVVDNYPTPGAHTVS